MAATTLEHQPPRSGSDTMSALLADAPGGAILESCLHPRYRTGIPSNSFVGAREREQEAHGIEDLVDEIVYSHETGMSKPDPRIHTLLCSRLDVHPKETVFLDDADQRVTGAREAGLHAVQYQDTAQAIEEIEKLLTRA